MPTVSLGAGPELGSTSLREAKNHFRPLFAAPSVARSAGAVLDGLLGAEQRKTGLMGGEAANRFLITGGESFPIPRNGVPSRSV